MTARPALEHAYVVTVGERGLLLGAFLEVSGLALEYETYEYAEGGNNQFVHRLRGRMKQSNLTLRTGVTGTTTLLDWVMGTGPLAGPQNIYLAFTDARGTPMRTFGFASAVPIRWTGPSANVSANAVATESLEIAHQGLNSA